MEEKKNKEGATQQAVLFKFESRSSQIEEFTLVNDDILLNFNKNIGQKWRCEVVS